MDYIAQLKEAFSVSSVTIDERIKQVAIKFNIQPSQMPAYSKLCELIASFPKRDTIKFFFTDDSTSLSIGSSNLRSIEAYTSYVSGLFKNDSIRVTITIDKKIKDEKLSIYCYQRFASDLLELTISEILDAFSDLYTGINHLYFEIFDSEIFFRTGTMVFSSAEHTIDWTLSDRQAKLDICQTASSFYHQATRPLLPEDFKIEVDFENNPLTVVFSKICTILSLAYLSTTSSIQNNQLYIQITGQRNLDYIFDLSSINPNPELYNIYYWIFTDGNAVDKALLARNSISAHCKFTDISNLDGKTFSSIQANYNLYLKNNVAQYIDLTNAMAGFICESVNNISDCLSQLFGHFKTNLLAVLSFIFTVFLANIVSDQPLENIFTYDIVMILFAVLGGSLCYYFISLSEVIIKRKRITKQYNILIEHYKKTLSEDDITIITNNDQTLRDAQTSLKSGIILWSIVWILFIVGSFVFIDYIGDGPHIIGNVISWIKHLFA